MADPVTMTDISILARDHSDIRREAAEHTNEIVKEGLKESFNIRGDVKDARYAVSDRVDDAKDTLINQFVTVARDTADLRAQVVQTISEVRLAGEKTAKDNEIAVLKNTIEGQKNTQFLSEKITTDGEKTRALINELKYGDLNRMLIERNSELVEERGHGRYWHGRAEQNQWASLQTQLQAFGSQIQETRQGMVNFGTMAGVGQTSSSNNV